MNTAISLHGGRLTVRLRPYDMVMALMVITTLAFYDIKLVFLGMQLLAYGYTLLQMLYKGVRHHVLWYILWLVALCSYSMLSLFWKDEANTTVVTLTLSIIQVGLICACIINYCTDRLHLHRVIWFFMIAAVALCVRFVMLVPVELWGQGDRFSKDTIFGSNTPAMVLSYAAVFALWMFLYRANTGAERWWLLVAMLVFMFVSMMAGTRKGILIFAAALVILLLGKAQNLREAVGKVFLAAALAVGIYILMMEVPVLYGSIGYRIESLVMGVLGEETDSSTLGRSLYISDALKVFRQHPFLGVGQDGYRYLNPYHFTYSHNNYTELLANLGLVGFCCFYSLHIWLLARCRYLGRQRMLPLCLLAMLLIADIATVSIAGEITYVLLGIAVGAVAVARTEKR